MIRQTPAAVLVFLFILSGESSSQQADPLLTRAGQIGATIEILGNVRTAVEQKHKGAEERVYKLVAMRLVQCGMTYGILGKQPQSDASTSQHLTTLMNLYITASSVLYPNTGEYKRDLDAARDEMLKMKARNDKKELFYFLRNCKDFAESGPQGAETAITELDMR